MALLLVIMTCVISPTATPSSEASEDPVSSLTSVPAQEISVIRLVVSASPIDGGRVEVLPSGDDGRYDPGTNLLLTAKPTSCFQFVSWAGDVGGSANPLSVVINSAMSVIAAFAVIPPGPTATVQAAAGASAEQIPRVVEAATQAVAG